jgi:hypothetical protein
MGEEKRPSEELSIDGRIILKWIIGNVSGVSTVLVLLRIETGSWLFCER